MATIRDGETGKRIVVVTSFDMSSNTSLEMYLKDPSGNVSGPFTATLGTTTTTDENGASVAANEWAYYDLAAATDIDEPGEWGVQLVYTNTGATPTDTFYTGFNTITVLEGASGLS